MTNCQVDMTILRICISENDKLYLYIVRIVVILQRGSCSIDGVVSDRMGVFIILWRITITQNFFNYDLLKIFFVKNEGRIIK